FSPLDRELRHSAGLIRLTAPLGYFSLNFSDNFRACRYAGSASAGLAWARALSPAFMYSSHELGCPKTAECRHRSIVSKTENLSFIAYDSPRSDNRAQN